MHATNVHQGGGRSLLVAILKALDSFPGAVCQLDSRMVLPQDISPLVVVRKVDPTLVKRLWAELWLSRNTSEEDVVLCFGNLPPVFKLRARTVVFVQNRYLVDRGESFNLPRRVRARLSLERLWLSLCSPNVCEFVVQTPSMKELLEHAGLGKAPVSVLPFASQAGDYTRKMAARLFVGEKKKYSYVYVATGEPHKNHRCLFAAWCLLAKEGFFPSLCVTLDTKRFPSLCAELDVLRSKHNINVTNVGELPHCQALSIYRETAAVIFPSKFESFGLPLVEARQAGLPVLASEMDYVRDVLDPEQSFDPCSPVSISRAVKRHEGWEEQSISLLQASDFLCRILGD